MVPHVEKETRPRGSSDTRPLGYAIAIMLSVLLHVLPFPAYLLVGTVSWFGDPPPELPDHDTIIPVDLMLTEGPPPGAGAEGPKANKEPPIPTLEDPPAVIPPPAADAGAPDDPDASAETADAAVADARVDAEGDAAGDGPGDATIERDVAAPIPDGGVPWDGGRPDSGSPLADAAIARSRVPEAAVSVGTGDAAAASTDAALPGAEAGAEGGSAPFRPIRDPVGLAGDAKKITPKNPNVSLVIYLDKVRAHPLGRRFAPTLTKLENWRNFFQGTGLDPVRDIDRILIAGPQLRDSSRVVAVIRHNTSQQRVRGALQALVGRDGSQGQWVKAPVPVVKARVDGAERYFVMTGPRMLVVVPPDGLDQALGLSRNLRFPGGNHAVVLFLKYPANAFRDQPVRLPTSVEWMRFSMELKPGGGADARLEAKDKDAASAAANAPRLTEVINKAMVIDLIVTKRRLLNPVTFRAEGDRIRTETHVTDAQLRHILSFMAAKIEQIDRPDAPPASSR